MAKLTRDTARRSLLDLIDRLPPAAVVELTRNADVPARGVDLVIKIDVASAPREIQTVPPPAMPTPVSRR